VNRYAPESTSDLAELLRSSLSRLVSNEKPASKPTLSSKPKQTDYYAEPTVELAALLEPKPTSSSKPKQVDYYAEPTIELAALLEPHRRGNNFRHDASEETGELVSLLDRAAAAASAGTASTSSSSASTGANVPGLAVGGTSSCALATVKRLETAAREFFLRGRQVTGPHVGDWMVAAKRFFDASHRWALSSARDVVQVSSDSLCRRDTWVSLFFTLQKIILGVIIATCAFLIPVELAWRLGPEAEDFY